jgi:putative ABC transport system substrate-binding protein
VLRDQGYVEGRNLALEHRYAGGRLERFPALAADLAQMKVDVILASSPLSIRAARQATSTIPIVMINGDPEMFGTMSRPGGNITGLTAFQAELAGKQVELLKEAETTARALGLTVYVADAQVADDFEGAFAAIAKERAGGVGSPGGADAGGLISYLPSRQESYRRAGDYVSRILKGAHAGDLPIEQPSRFELTVNLRTARALRLTLPQALVLRADRLIE